MGGMYNATPPTLPDKARSPLQLDASGNLKITAATLPLPTGGATEATLALLKAASGLRGGMATYRCSGTGYAAYAAPTDLLTINGSATKTVAITTVSISMQATAGALVNLFWIKRSVANTLGTATNPAGISFDSGDTAATAVVSLYTAAPTLGAAVGTLSTVVGSASTLTATPSAYSWAGQTGFGSPASPTLVNDLRKPIILRGVAESLCLNLGGAAIPAGFTATWFVEWVEY